MIRLISSMISILLFSPAVFAGESGYSWFDMNTCSYGSVSTDDYSADGSLRCIDFLREEYSNGKLVSFHFEDNPICGVVAGAKYIPIKANGRSSPAFRCVAGCEKWVPPLLQLISQESTGDEVAHPAVTSAFKIFMRKCSSRISK